MLRIVHSRRSEQRIVMRQRWRDLLFLHWTIPALEIQRLLPPGLIVDEFEGRAYVGLVPFTMLDVAPAWFAPVPSVSNLLECNVRTYVRREDGSAPGVWFFSLDASGPVAVLAARAFFALPYFFAGMHQTEQRGWDQSLGDSGGWSRHVTYQSERHHLGSEGRCRIEYANDGDAARLAEPATLAHFLVERYTLYSYHSGRLFAGQVHHSPYIIERARLLSLQETLLAAAGLIRPGDQPLVHYSREVVVEISPLIGL